ncbi:MAG: indole-3-glycerol phosphate synthase TrpC [Armatimonadota bacterium]
MNRLDQILADKCAEVEAAKRETPLDEVRRRAQSAPPVRSFREALLTGPHPVSLIAEVKRASPSKGTIRGDADPAELARAYERGGASCISVLTETRHFRGSPQDLVQVRDAVDLPILRKDFLFDDWQVYESRAMGADCILLIVAALTDDLLARLVDRAREVGLNVLVEVHTEEEVERAAGVAADLIGINNRDLSTFETSLETTERLAPLVPASALVVAESAIWSREDALRVARAGARAILVGEALMRAESAEQAVRELLG